MTRKRDTARKESTRQNDKLQNDKAVSRREFFKAGRAAGVGAAVLSGPAAAQAQGIHWNYEADVVVLGSGCVGLHAAVRARDLGASVLVIEQNFDVGGKLVHSGGYTSLGGGDADPGTRPDWGRSRRHGADGAADQAGGPGRRSRPSVPRHDRLVGGRRHRRRPLSLQRPRAASRLGRQRAQDPAVHDGQLRPLRAHRRHPSGRRHDPRAGPRARS